MEKKTIECSACSGKGYVSGPCKKCGGKGVVTCPVCGGEGKEFKIVCQTCHEGYVTDSRSLDDDKTLCPDCHGNYREDLGPCKKCGGKGEIVCESCNGAGKTKCEACKGKGKISCWDFIDVVQLRSVDEFDEKFGFARGEIIQGEMLSSSGLLRRFEGAKSLFHVHDITRDFWKELSKAAKNGDGDAAFGLGLCYANDIYYGDKKNKDYAEAEVECFKESAEAGNGYGQFIYGCKCLCDYFPTNPKFKERCDEGIMWLEKAGDQDVMFALVELALIDMFELPVLKNMEDKEERALRAIRWCNKILAIKNSCGESDDLFHEFAKVHIGLLENILDAWKTGEPLATISDKMKKWSNVVLVPVLGRQKVQKRVADKRKCYKTFKTISIFFGFLGGQFAYARRWDYFLANLAVLVATVFFPWAFVVCLISWFWCVFCMRIDDVWEFMGKVKRRAFEDMLK